MRKFKGVGKRSKVDHVALQTTPGNLEAVAKLFQGLGYKENKARRLHGSWGAAYFMEQEGSISIQITDQQNLPASGVEYPASENHIAIAVDDPEVVADQIAEWAAALEPVTNPEKGPKHAMGRVPLAGGKFIILLPTLFIVDIELVPNQ